MFLLNKFLKTNAEPVDDLRPAETCNLKYQTEFSCFLTYNGLICILFTTQRDSILKKKKVARSPSCPYTSVPT
jgi:hypothetical protein